MDDDEEEYDEPESPPEIRMNEESKKILAPYASFLKTFSVVIILFLTMSYISNK